MGGLLPPADVTPGRGRARPALGRARSRSATRGLARPTPARVQFGPRTCTGELDFGVLGHRNRTATWANASLIAPHDGTGAPAHRTSTEVRGQPGHMVRTSCSPAMAPRATFRVRARPATLER